jgi:glyoxylase-like metal-dependent hydrolase (beta-lactamase superfamily II)
MSPSTVPTAAAGKPGTANNTAAAINPVAAVSTPGEWYASASLGDGVTHIFEPFIDPFYRCNIWHVRGRDGSLLFDSGLGVVSLVGQFPWLGDSPLLAVASHTHFDHIGNHHEFAQRACHVCEAEIMAAPSAQRTLATVYAKVAMFERLPPGGFDEAAYCVKPAPATRLLEAGDVIDLGSRHFEIIHVPGHSPGSIALWESASGVLLAGDAVYDGELIDDAYHSNPGDYLDTMRRLRELPVRVVHAGHYPSFGRQRFLELIDDYVRGRRTPGCPADVAPRPA